MKEELERISKQHQAVVTAFNEEMQTVANQLEALKITAAEQLEALPEEPEDGDDPLADTRLKLENLVEQLDDLALDVENDPLSVEFDSVLSDL